MSEQLMICLIAVAVNLAGMLIIYSILSHALARVAWHAGGVFGAIVLLVVAQLFWIAPALLIVGDRNGGHAAAYALWFGNWLVSGFSLVLFLRTVTSIPVALKEAARMDGLSGFSSWRHTVLPFVRRDLTLIAFFTVMATLLPFWGFINLPEATNVVTIFERSYGVGERIVTMTGASLVGVLPLIAIFFAARKA
jgi:ABC-type glycerol-3-phosphate transport system permease component